MRRILTWLDEPHEVAGALLIGVPLALYVGVVAADIIRSQAVPIWPILALCLLGVVVIRGWRIDRFRAGSGGVDIDIDESGESGDE